MQIAIAVYPEFTALDALGPYQVLAHLPGAEVVFVAEQAGPVVDDGRLTITAHAAFDEIDTPDVIVVPGGLIAIELARSETPVVQWIRRVAPTATWITSVCTGSLLLGAAGVLTGRQATSHWQFTDRLTQFGATVADQRVVIDGKVVTAAGVSAGIDMALQLTARLFDEQTAMTVQLGLEYAPEPPYAAGSPKTAPAGLVEHVRAMYTDY